MQIEITKTEYKNIFIDVEIPYYFKQDLSDEKDYIIFGRIDHDKCTTIRYLADGIRTSFEIEVEKHKTIKNSGLGAYFDNEFKSSELEFSSWEAKAKVFVSHI